MGEGPVYKHKSLLCQLLHTALYDSALQSHSKQCAYSETQHIYKIHTAHS
ncbi:unnamed protein product [Staurois parvus]|uniref:Uncharacterized protein n=1 Tax=Staurois parvus TaxID=386267 RepID=A0ABN9EYU5_9NEOB|nr:unnamed protein product [Staurois parvus]